MAAAGPSPRVRGADGADVHRDKGAETIPRVREQQPSETSLYARAGPSPRVRGAGRARDPHQAGPGTIPAGGEQARIAVITRITGGPSPRMRGTGVHGGRLRGRWGPSPRVRGAEGVGDDGAGDDGTIPTGAGSSRCARSTWRCRLDHPRGCGEQQSLEKAQAEVRGTILAGAGSRDPSRGYGEQSVAPRCMTSCSGPFPRVRGSSCRRSSRLFRPRGPPRRVRGTDKQGRRRPCHLGTISAGAESSLGPGPASCAPGGRCGEQSRSAGAMSRWGTIPASAGSRTARPACTP
jgi:hypothetical protein